jgi:flagellar assembly protein FliH
MGTISLPSLFAVPFGADSGAPVAANRFTPLSFPSLDTANADRELESARQRGYAAGYAEGTRAAEVVYAARSADLEVELAAEMQFAHARASRIISILNTAAEAITKQVEPSLLEAEQTLIDLSIQLAEAIIGVELQDGEVSARAALTRALEATESDTEVTLRLAPDDLQVLKLDHGLPEGVTFVGDETLRVGDAIAELPLGLVDARIESAFRRAKYELLTAGNGASGPRAGGPGAGNPGNPGGPR